MKKVFLVVMLVLILIWPWSSASQLTTEKPKWCLYYEFESMDHYRETVPPAQTVFIEFNGKRVRVHIPCEQDKTPDVGALSRDGMITVVP